MLDNVQLVAPDPSDRLWSFRPRTVEPRERAIVRIAEEFAPSVAETFRILAGEDALPAVFHCTSGKDRTGIVAALMLDVLGVADEMIASDYVLTGSGPGQEHALDRTTRAGVRGVSGPDPARAARPRPERILDFLDGLRARYGSVPEFLTRSGVPERQLNILGRGWWGLTGSVGAGDRRSIRRSAHEHLAER